MITSTKIILKKEKNTDRNPGQIVKANLYRKNHTKLGSSTEI